MPKLLKINRWLIIILILGGILRVFDIANNPPALYGDELTLAYDAYSILKTGHDQKGNFLPITFEHGEGRPAAYVYLSIPFIWLFGPSALGVRLLSIIAGLGLIYLGFMFSKTWINKSAGLTTALVIAINPWAINLSRGGFETNLALFLTVLATYFITVAKSKPWLVVLAVISFALAFNTYQTYKLTVPLIMIVLLWGSGIYKVLLVTQFRKYLYLSILILTFTGIVFVAQSLTSSAQVRFTKLNIFNQEIVANQISAKVIQERGVSSAPELVKPIIYNQYIEYLQYFTETYFSNFSLDFFFVHGDRNPRHNMATIGLFYPFELLLMVSGLVFLFLNKRKELALLIMWLLIAALPSTLMGSAHALRGSLMLFPLVLFSGIGLYYLISKIPLPKRKLIVMLIGVIVLAQVVYFTSRLFLLAPNQFSHFWSYSAKAASELVEKNKQNFDYIILIDRIDSIELAYPVYAKLNPQLVIDQNKLPTGLGGYKLKKYENVYLGYLPADEMDKFARDLNSTVLLITTKEDQKYLPSSEIISELNGQVGLIYSKYGASSQ